MLISSSTTSVHACLGVTQDSELAAHAPRTWRRACWRARGSRRCKPPAALRCMLGKLAQPKCTLRMIPSAKHQAIAAAAGGAPTARCRLAQRPGHHGGLLHRSARYAVPIFNRNKKIRCLRGAMRRRSSNAPQLERIRICGLLRSRNLRDVTGGCTRSTDRSTNNCNTERRLVCQNVRAVVVEACMPHTCVIRHGSKERKGNDERSRCRKGTLDQIAANILIAPRQILVTTVVEQ